MSCSSRVAARTVCLCLLILAVHSQTAAQFAWPLTADGSCIKVEYLAPSLAQQSSLLEIHGYTLSFSGHLRIGEGTFLVAEIPYTSTSIQYSFSFLGGSQTISKSSIGNVSLGLEFVGKDSPLFGELGIRLPTMSEENMGASTLGVLGDVNRWEIYFADLVAVQGAVNYHPVFESGVSLFFRAGPSVWIPTSQGDAEVLLDYGAGVGFENKLFRAGAGISGRAIVTEEQFVFEKNTIHHFEFGANFRFAQLRPGVFLRIPLDQELRDALSHTLGISLSYVFE